jgi:hypothetical protein
LNTSKVRKKSVKFALEPLGGLDQQGVKIDARKASTPPPPVTTDHALYKFTPNRFTTGKFLLVVLLKRKETIKQTFP